MHDPAQPGSAIRQVIANVLALFTRRPFYILIPILVGALLGPVLVGIGFGAETAGVLALIVIVALILVLGSGWVRRMVRRVGRYVYGALRKFR
jgi:hypothetical protein